MHRSNQGEYERRRQPRVRIVLDSQQGRPELPFVVGVIGDYRGDSRKTAEPMSSRGFVRIDKFALFDEILAHWAPALDLDRVEDVLSDDEREMKVHLEFRSMRDFEPGQVARQVTPLRRLLAARSRLRSLLDGKPDPALESVLDRASGGEDIKGLARQLFAADGPSDVEEHHDSD